MKRKNTQSLREILDEFTRSQHLDDKLAEHRVINALPLIVGNGIAGYIRSTYFHHGILYVNLNSSVVRNELMLMRTRLIQQLNQEVGNAVVKDIHFK